jgi:hypothetical protein
VPFLPHIRRVLLKPDGTGWRTVGEVRGKLANGVCSQYSHTTSERGVSSITNADAHTSAASSRLTDAPADLNGLAPFGKRRNLVSARLPSRFKRSLLLASTWGLWPPQPLSLLGHGPYPAPLLPIGSGYFRTKSFPLKIPQQSHPGYSSCLHGLWRWNSVPKRRHIKFRRRGITQKKEYK